MNCCFSEKALCKFDKANIIMISSNATCSPHDIVENCLGLDNNDSPTYYIVVLWQESENIGDGLQHKECDIDRKRPDQSHSPRVSNPVDTSTGKYLFMSHFHWVSNPVYTSAGKYLFMAHSPRVSNTVDTSAGKYLFIYVSFLLSLYPRRYVCW